MTTEPTTQQETEYDRLLAAGVDPDLAAYMANIDDCNCVLPEQSCRICRGAAKWANGLSLEEILAMPSVTVVTALGDTITIAQGPEQAKIMDCYRGLKALVDAGRYREWPCHVGGRTTPRFVAEPIEGAATGPTFVLDPGRKWEAVDG